MASNENKASKTAEERVEVYIERGSANDDPNFYVSINGVNYLLPRGKKSMVPAHVAEEIARSKRARDKMDETIDKMLEASK